MEEKKGEGYGVKFSKEMGYIAFKLLNRLKGTYLSNLRSSRDCN